MMLTLNNVKNKSFLNLKIFIFRLDVGRPDKISAADIASICQEAGM
jgi:ATP-dependent 26S proteasome regulatory subunit